MKDRNIRIQNIFYMLAFVYDQLRYSGFQKLGTEDFKDGYHLLGKLFLHACRLQLTRGFPHDYRMYTEATSHPHGQIQMTESIVQGTLMNKQVIVEDDSFSVDIPENQLVKMVLTNMMSSQLFPQNQRLLAKKIWRSFWPVSDMAPNAYWRIKRQIHRLGRHNSLLVLLSEILFEGKIFANSQQNLQMLDIEDQLMSRLYEKFLLKYYQQHFPDLEVKSAYIPWSLDGLGNSDLPKMHSDVRICGKHRTVILDAKYYQHSFQRHFDVKTFHSNNIYQILSYVLNESKTGSNSDVEGILLYAKTDEKTVADGDLMILGHRFRIKTLDLNVDWKHLTAQLDQLIVLDD